MWYWSDVVETNRLSFFLSPVLSCLPGTEETSLDRPIPTEAMYSQPYPDNLSGDVLTVDQIASYDLSALERGIPQVYTTKPVPEDKMQYLQVSRLGFCERWEDATKRFDGLSRFRSVLKGSPFPRDRI